MAKESFVQLAHTFKPNKHAISGWYASTKLDGCRIIWDGGASRGVPKENVPWANMNKDVTAGQIATGLWSRYGNVIHAPDWWLDKLPLCPLDGEGWIGPKSWEETSSIMSKLPKNRDPSRWREIKFKVFNIAPPEQLFKPRIIDETNFKKKIGPNVLPWWQERFKGFLPKGRSFHTIYSYMKLKIPQNEVVSIHEQVELSLVETEALQTARDMLDIVLATHGEGLILRRGADMWIPERSHNLLKMKPWEDAEATVVGYTTGDLTDLGSKYLGLMGAAICRLPNGKTFKVSGFTDEERYFQGDEARDWAIENPACEVPDWINHPKFPRGSILTYKYRELTNDEIPKEARYLRKPNKVV
jgi:DNA ligase-1